MSSCESAGVCLTQDDSWSVASGAAVASTKLQLSGLQLWCTTICQEMYGKQQKTVASNGNGNGKGNGHVARRLLA
jgi:hypothetical protein